MYLAYNTLHILDKKKKKIFINFYIFWIWNEKPIVS